MALLMPIPEDDTKFVCYFKAPNGAIDRVVVSDGKEYVEQLSVPKIGAECHFVDKCILNIMLKVNRMWSGGSLKGCFQPKQQQTNPPQDEKLSQQQQNKGGNDSESKDLMDIDLENTDVKLLQPQSATTSGCDDEKLPYLVKSAIGYEASGVASMMFFYAITLLQSNPSAYRHWSDCAIIGALAALWPMNFFVSRFIERLVKKKEHTKSLLASGKSPLPLSSTVESAADLDVSIVTVRMWLTRLAMLCVGILHLQYFNCDFMNIKLQYGRWKDFANTSIHTDVNYVTAFFRAFVLPPPRLYESFSTVLYVQLIIVIFLHGVCIVALCVFWRYSPNTFQLRWNWLLAITKKEKVAPLSKNSSRERIYADVNDAANDEKHRVTVDDLLSHSHSGPRTKFELAEDEQKTAAIVQRRFHDFKLLQKNENGEMVEVEVDDFDYDSGEFDNNYEILYSLFFAHFDTVLFGARESFFALKIYYAVCLVAYVLICARRAKFLRKFEEWDEYVEYCSAPWRWSASALAATGAVVALGVALPLINTPSGCLGFVGLELFLVYLLNGYVTMTALSHVRRLHVQNGFPSE